ncbi:hypothetical protein B0A50_07911 [Salinomyces thailandicus]|uniref:ubiquitinyl hydrolase 1 n=1 Tax=Salinomyces thailandicus TaxID=706561 RepID=A0A4U0TL83_9PEZI|nr:hypothetical protein B0A50_07911 [Salinomyces thailandica]
MSGLVYRNGDDIHWEVPNADRLWQAMGSLDQIKGYMLRIEPSEMRYDAGYIHEGLNFILARLPAIHRSLGKLQDPPQRKFAIMAWLCAMAFPLDEAGCCIVQALAMFYKTVHVIGVQPPTAELFSVQEGRNCSAHTLSQIGQSHRRDYRYCPEYQLGRLLNEKRQVYENRRHHAWQSASDSAVASFVNALEIQWPREVPFVSSDHIAWTYIEVDKAMIDIRRKFKAWHDNKTLYEFLEKLVCEMRRCEITPFRAPELTEVTSARMASVSGYTPVDQLFSVPAPQLPDSCSEIDMHTEVSAQSGDPHLLRLHSLLSPLELSVGTSQYERRYTTNLRASLHALLEKNRNGSVKLHTTAKGAACYLEYCERHVSEVYHILNNTAIHSCRTFSAGGAQLLPRFSPLLLLQQLSHAKWGKLPDSWKRVIVHYGVALTALQRAQQIVELTRSDQQNGLVKELSEAGHTNWIPYDRPESLLIEVESGIRIRPVQEDIGKLMCSPPSSSNAVMQLNMGQGKSSVIVPMIAAVLANEERLIRVIVAKPQSKQMAQMLIAKLGGLVNRRVYHLPISRSLRLDIVGARAVDDLLHDCMMNRGVLLVQPEHILSFRLMVLESYITGKEDLGRQLTKTQDFLDHRARDIVDESDENFNVRFELIYTMGSQKSIELGGNRWSTIQQVLNLVKSLAPMVAEEHPGGLELLPGSHGGFARIRILHADVGTVLVSCVARQICEKGLDGLHFSRLTETLRKAIFRYITQIRLSDAEKNAVEGTTFWSTTTSSPLLLLRGILACGVLEFALSQKRWRVNYGLTTRTPPTRLAVPYLAKDSPSPRSEFSHPDVVIMLTSLCYYYQGLENEDLFIALAHLIESDQAANKYQAWVKDAVNLPNAFSQLQGVNLEDRPQCVSELFPALRHGKSVVDYYLSHIVFPKEMKEFPHKLSASGWDIGKQRTQLMTGFSGTNDSGCLLPLDVKQCDIAGQKHTNALVLEQLLQDGNSVDLMVAAAGESLNANCLLASITKLKPPVQVVLDVGAQIIDLNNLEVAKAWLKLSDSSKEAVVFLNDADDLCVIDRKDRIDQLQTSSFATRLDVCLVFLDESHTRGIDLKLPVDYRAAVTLGANLTKDRLVQACMRMRELGQGQTVIFCIPIEIQDKIMAAMNDKKGNITVLDVLQWSICETHTEMRRGMPLWLVQGQRFIRQQRLWQQATQDGTITLSKSHAELFLENEALSIDQRYRPRPDPSTESSVSPAEDPSSQLMIDRRREFGNLDFGASTLQEEQERELSPEIEQERQVQKAPPASPAVHQLHPDVKQFALQGVLKRDSKAHTTAFESLHGLSFANQCKLSELAGEGNLLVSTDFYTTIDTGGAKGACDAFQRHVSWLLTTCAPGDSKTIDSIMIISPYEANLLHPLMATSPSALHLYKPRTNSAFTALDDLAFYTISANNASPPTLPRALAVQLNLFAGQLYLDCYADYTETCRFLGLSTQRLTQSLEDAGWRVDAEGFILSDDKGRVGGSSGVTRSPVRFLKSFLSTIRRHGEVISGTQVGGLLDGKLFGPEEWES